MLLPPNDQPLLFADLGIHRLLQQFPVAHLGGQVDQRIGLRQMSKQPEARQTPPQRLWVPSAVAPAAACPPPYAVTGGMAKSLSLLSASCRRCDLSTAWSCPPPKFLNSL